MNQSNETTLPAILCFLKALEQTAFHSEYVVRGSFVSRQWMGAYPRTCQDLDLLNLSPYDPANIIEQVRQVLQHAETLNKRDEQIQFDANRLSHHEIWKDSPAPGLRFELPYSFNTTENHLLQLDIACNDPMIGAPDKQMIDGVMVYGVPLETMTAWKLHGLFEHLNGPWQSKTLWDLYVFCRYNTLDKATFIAATELAFSSRLDPIAIISRLIEGDFGSSKKSRQHWKRDFSSFSAAPFVALTAVLEWLQAFLKTIFKDHYKAPLLTQSDLIRFRVETLRKQIETHPEAKQKLKTLSVKRKVLGHKAYQTINHLPTSRLGPSERCIQAKQYAFLADPAEHDPDHTIIIQEKLDGSCVSAYRKGEEIVALGRAGDLAEDSPNESRRLWAAWVADNQSRFMAVLEDGEWLCGEWLAMVHGTHYQLKHEPFVAFDLFTNINHALNYERFSERVAKGNFIKPKLLHYGEPCALQTALDKLGDGHHGATDTPEGLIWRLERKGKLAFRAKYVRHDKVDGCYLTEATGEPEQWNITRDIL